MANHSTGSGHPEPVVRSEQVDSAAVGVDRPKGAATGRLLSVDGPDRPSGREQGKVAGRVRQLVRHSDQVEIAQPVRRSGHDGPDHTEARSVGNRSCSDRQQVREGSALPTWHLSGGSAGWSHAGSTPPSITAIRPMHQQADTGRPASPERQPNRQCSSAFLLVGRLSQAAAARRSAPWSDPVRGTALTVGRIRCTDNGSAGR